MEYAVYCIPGIQGRHTILFAFKSPCYCHFSWDTHPVAYYASEGGLLQGRLGGMRGEVKYLKPVNFSKKMFNEN